MPTLALRRRARDSRRAPARAAGALRMPRVETWDTFPFDGTMTPRALLAPVEREEPRHGEAGVGRRRRGAERRGNVLGARSWNTYSSARTSRPPPWPLTGPPAPLARSA